jgi:hypothetical protein
MIKTTVIKDPVAKRIRRDQRIDPFEKENKLWYCHK